MPENMDNIDNDLQLCNRKHLLFQTHTDEAHQDRVSSGRMKNEDDLKVGNTRSDIIEKIFQEMEPDKE